jgi:hypothetical protein
MTIHFEGGDVQGLDVKTFQLSNGTLKIHIIDQFTNKEKDLIYDMNNVIAILGAAKN